MASGESAYLARFPTPELLEKGRSNAISLSIELNGSAVTPSAVTVSIYDEDGAAVVDAASATPGSTSTYTVTSGSLASKSYSAGWTVEWTATISGSAYTFRRECFLCRRVFYPPITQSDLLRRHQDLSSLRESARSSFADEIEEAHVEITNRLINEGNRPNLITSPSALRQIYLWLALSNVFRNFAPSVGPESSYSQHAEHYRAMYEAEWRQIRFTYDADEDGVPDSSSERRSSGGVVFLTAPGHRRGWVP